MIKKRKTQAIAAKYQKARRGISMFKKEKENYNGDTKNKIDSDQANNEY